MRHIALTGNAAAGKSTVAELFRGWGATVIDADALVREVQRPGTPVFHAIVARFGPDVVAADGTLDRAALRARVLADPGERAALEAIVHPAVAARCEAAAADAARAGARLVVHDIPLLFEALDPAAFDAVVLVDAPVAVRHARLRARGLSDHEADRLMAAQMPADLKRARSHFVIENGGSRAALRTRARAVFASLDLPGDAG